MTEDKRAADRRYIRDHVMRPIPGSETEARTKRGEYRHVEYGYEVTPDENGNLVGNYYEREQS